MTTSAPSPQPPQAHLAGKPVTGYVVLIASIAGALVVLALAVMDFARLTGLRPQGPSGGGYQLGGLIGVIVRTLILGVICACGILHGLELIDPMRFSSTAMAMSRLRSFYDIHGLRRQKWPEPPTCDLDYAGYSDAQLSGVCSSIDPKAAGDRWEALLFAVKQRVETYEDHVRILPDRLAIERQGEVLEGVRWADVCKIVTYKIDLGTVDEICLGFFDQNRPGEVFEISERLLGFGDLFADLQARYPSIPERWYFDVMIPAFERKETVLYERTGGGPVST